MTWWEQSPPKTRRRGAITPLRGSMHPNAKLTEALVVEMRLARKAGWPTAEISRRFGVSESTVYHATSPKGERWRHVEEPQTP